MKLQQAWGAVVLVGLRKKGIYYFVPAGEWGRGYPSVWGQCVCGSSSLVCGSCFPSRCVQTGMLSPLPGPLEAAGHSAVVCVSALGEVESFGERVLVHMCPQTSVALGQLGGWVSSWLPV